MAIYSESTAGPHPRLRSQSAPARILVAEDPFVSSFLRTILQRRGHQVVVGEPDRVRGLLRDGRMEAQVVITNRPEAFLPFADTLPILYIAANPDPALLVVITNRPEAFLPFADTLPILYIAANPDPALVSCFSTCRVLRKPFRNDDLLEAVQELAAGVV